MIKLVKRSIKWYFKKYSELYKYGYLKKINNY